MARHLSQWLVAEGLRTDDLTQEAVARFVAARRAMTSNMRSQRALVPLLTYLRRLGLTRAAPVVVATAPAEVVLQRFAQHLTNERALAPATVRSYLSQVRPFMAAHPGHAGRWESLTARQVTAYVTGRAAGQRPRSVQVGANALRSLLRWMWRQGLVASPLAEAVGSVAAPTTTPPRRALSPGEVRDLFAACGVPAAGGGMAEAGQLLRHSSATATAIYAKADLTALAGLARPWPGAGR